MLTSIDRFSRFLTITIIMSDINNRVLRNNSATPGLHGSRKQSDFASRQESKSDVHSNDIDRTESGADGDSLIL